MAQKKNIYFSQVIFKHLHVHVLTMRKLMIHETCAWKLYHVHSCAYESCSCHSQIKNHVLVLGEIKGNSVLHICVGRRGIAYPNKYKNLKFK
jgi:phage-related protein